MTNKRYSEEKVYEAIKTGLNGLKVLMKDSIRRRGGLSNLSNTQKYNAGRALVFAGDVAKNPQKYFSRATTQADWVARAQEFAREKNLENVSDAYYIVHGPGEIVSGKMDVLPSVPVWLRNQYYLFCKLIVDWEYNRTSPREMHRFTAEMDADEIYEKMECIARDAKACQASPVARLFGNCVGIRRR